MAFMRCRDSIRSAHLSPDGERVLLVDGLSRLWLRELSQESKRYLPAARFGNATSADFGPDGHSILSTWTTTRAQLRALPDGQILANLIHPARVMYAVYSPDRRWIATAAADSTVNLWDGATQDKRLEIKLPGHVCYRVSFSLGESYVLVIWWPEGKRQGGKYVLGLYPVDVAAAARRARFADLTPDERDHFQVGSAEERREHRRAWVGGHIYGEGQAAER
jgi:WD40 repeat protein